MRTRELSGGPSDALFARGAMTRGLSDSFQRRKGMVEQGLRHGG